MSEILANPTPKSNSLGVLPERHPTCYDGWPLSEVVSSRLILLSAVADGRFSDHERRNLAGLLDAATVELADRLSQLIVLNDPPAFGLALESLAADCGIVPAPRRLPIRDMSQLAGTMRGTGDALSARSPVPVRRGGRRRG